MAKKQPIPKWQKKRNARLKFYAKVVRATRKELAAEGIEMPYKEARKFASEYVYSQYKGKPYSKVKVADIRNLAKEAIKNIQQPAPPKRVEFVDPRAISEVDVNDIPYWEINDFITGTGDKNIYQARALQGKNAGKNLRFEVIASADDRTGELTLLEYDGVDSGVINMVERIREAVNNGSGPYFSGTVGKREGFTDDSDPNTYILQFILYVNDEPVVPPDETVTPLPRVAMTPEEIAEYQRMRREKLSKKDKALAKKEEAEKIKRRKTAVRPTKKKKIKEAPAPPPPPKKEKKTRGDRVLELTDAKIKELAMLRKDLDDGIITKKEYKRDRLKIMESYDLALSKLKRGGVV